MHSFQLSQRLAREDHRELLENVYWIDRGITRARIGGENNDLLLLEYDGAELPAETGRRIEQVIAQIVNSIRRLRTQIVFEHQPATTPATEDPLPELERRGWVTPLFAGGYAYRGQFLLLLRGLERLFRTYARSLGSEEYWFPGLLDYGAAQRADYLVNHPQNANFVCHLHDDLDTFRDYRNNLRSSDRGFDAGQIEPPDLILAPAVCYHFWHRLAGVTLDAGQLLTGTALGSCNRFEGRLTRGLERLREFKMREIFAIGPPAEVLAFRDRLLRDLIDFLKTYAIAGRVETAVDPFFVDDYSAKRLFQVGLALKQEARAWLPYAESHLAIASLNHHQDFFSRVFDIRAADAKPIHSCCVGFGLDRWCLAIFAQYGLHEERWPPSLRAVLSTADAD